MDDPGVRDREAGPVGRPLRGPWQWLVLPAAVVLVTIGSIVGGVLAGRDGDADRPRDPGGLAFGGEEPVVPPDVQSARGLAELVEVVAEETGSTEAHRVVLYPEYAVLDLPVPGAPDRSRSYYWNGSLGAQEYEQLVQGPVIDLAALDPELVTRALGEALALVEDPTTAYVIVRAPDEEGAFLWGYATADVGQSGYVSFAGDGTVVRRVPPTP
ncbi:hypothetical protein [Nocardioides caldifontis]|uniref:hypothetical protein n=1 Tax=Nocardioides caldifontis TaxID=2588938 RepID=UPI0011DF45EE|nr:hypothetical protein [Nocardioides caldifontis]